MSTKTCDICGDQFTAIDLKIHRRREHVLVVEVDFKYVKLDIKFKDESFLCPVSDCQKSYKTIDTFRVHLKTHDATVKVRKYDDPIPATATEPKDVQYFDFERGCQRALLDDASTSKSNSKAYHQTLSLSCEPVQFNISTKDDETSFPVPALVHSNIVKSVVDKYEFKDNIFSGPLNCNIQLHKENKSVEPTKKKATTLFNSSILICKIIRTSFLPGLLDQIEYLQPTVNLYNDLNTDYRMNPKLLQAVAKLHAGAIISDGDQVLVLLTCEIYARSKSMDCHGETSIKSLPAAGDAMFIGICEESDGRGIKKKLKIGAKHWNILVTMSVSLSNSNCIINIGPETIGDFNSNDLVIFYPADNLLKFEEALAEGLAYNPPNDLNSLRQLVSGFNDPSTYHQYRASAEQFLPVYETFIPATVFTLCDLPNDNYGVSSTSAPKIGSRFLSTMAASGWENNFKLPKESLTLTLQMYHAHGSDKSTAQWAVVQSFARKLENHFNNVDNCIDVLRATDLELATLASTIGQALHTANKQIAKNVESYLKEKFGRHCSKSS